MSDSLWKSLLSEFIGTFVVVFVGVSAFSVSASSGSVLNGALAFGLALMAVIYILGSYSGAHVNPAVSFGFAVAGQMSWTLMLGYWIAQLLGGITAAALATYFFGNTSIVSIGSFTNTDVWRAILMEAFITFFLVVAYLSIYRNPYLAIVSGLVIGLVLTFATLVGGSSTSGSTNPARSFGTAIFTNNLGSYWIYVVGPLLGGLLAALTYKLFVTNFDCCDKVDECGNKMYDECGRLLKECKRPVLDKCGKPVTECDGTVKYTTYIRPEFTPSYKQEVTKTFNY